MPRECCDHGVPGGCPVVCACGHACRRHDAGGCRFEGEPMVETLLTAVRSSGAPQPSGSIEGISAAIAGSCTAVRLCARRDCIRVSASLRRQIVMKAARLRGASPPRRS